MKKCSECTGAMEELSAKTPEGVEYRYFRCRKCGDEVLNMEQLHNVAERYRELKKYNVKLSRWGKSIGLRIPKELAEKYRLKDDGEVTIIPEKMGIRILATKT